MEHGDTILTLASEHASLQYIAKREILRTQLESKTAAQLREMPTPVRNLFKVRKVKAEVSRWIYFHPRRDHGSAAGQQMQANQAEHGKKTKFSLCVCEALKSPFYVRQDRHPTFADGDVSPAEVNLYHFAEED